MILRSYPNEISRLDLTTGPVKNAVDTIRAETVKAVRPDVKNRMQSLSSMDRGSILKMRHNTGLTPPEQEAREYLMETMHREMRGSAVNPLFITYVDDWIDDQESPEIDFPHLDNREFCICILNPDETRPFELVRGDILYKCDESTFTIMRNSLSVEFDRMNQKSARNAVKHGRAAVIKAAAGALIECNTNAMHMRGAYNNSGYRMVLRATR